MILHHRNEGPWAVLAGFATQLISLFLHANWIGWAGLAVSAGWFYLGYTRMKWEAEDRRDRKARPPIDRPDIDRAPGR
jgi:hypothetical protein